MDELDNHDLVKKLMTNHSAVVDAELLWQNVQNDLSKKRSKKRLLLSLCLLISISLLTIIFIIGNEKNIYTSIDSKSKTIADNQIRNSVQSPIPTQDPILTQHENPHLNPVDNSIQLMKKSIEKTVEKVSNDILNKEDSINKSNHLTENTSYQSEIKNNLANQYLLNDIVAPHNNKIQDDDLADNQYINPISTLNKNTYFLKLDRSRTIPEPNIHSTSSIRKNKKPQFLSFTGSYNFGHIQKEAKTTEATQILTDLENKEHINLDLSLNAGYSRFITNRIFLSTGLELKVIQTNHNSSATTNSSSYIDSSYFSQTITNFRGEETEIHSAALITTKNINFKTATNELYLIQIPIKVGFSIPIKKINISSDAGILLTPYSKIDKSPLSEEYSSLGQHISLTSAISYNFSLGISYELKNSISLISSYNYRTIPFNTSTDYALKSSYRSHGLSLGLAYQLK